MKNTLKTLSALVHSRELTRDYLPMTAGAIILAINFNTFIAPAKMAPGGLSGISLIINNFTGWPQGMTMLFVSIPIFVLGFFNLGRFRFLTRTAYVTLLYTTGVDLLAQWMPATGLTHDLLLNAIFGGITGGIGSGLIFRGRGTIAGTGIISRIIQFKTGIPTSQLYLMVDSGIILGIGILFGFEKALYAVLMLFVWGLATDYVLEGPSVIRTAFIITGAPEPVARNLMERLGVGVTYWEGRGMFTHETRSILFCTITRPDVDTLKSIVGESDEKAFIVIGQGHQAKGGILRPPKIAS
ncbi:MAG TPA: YitT family protein [Anaerolineales bacterium]|nr:YitT family protein [Anaerolineales bacterium]